MSASAVGVIFSNLHEENVPELVRRRTMASIPFGGRYRLIDFPLSNMVNSGITTVGLMANNNYRSLIDHLGSGKDWDLARKDGGIILLPPFYHAAGSVKRSHGLFNQTAGKIRSPFRLRRRRKIKYFGYSCLSRK